MSGIARWRRKLGHRIKIVRINAGIRLSRNGGLAAFDVAVVNSKQNDHGIAVDIVEINLVALGPQAGDPVSIDYTVCKKGVHAVQVASS